MLKLLNLAVGALSLFLPLMAALPIHAQQRGKASYYSRRANGTRTCSGQRLNNDSLVCAHRTHPFGTLLKVKNPANGKEVVVKVIDRGPHLRGRIIDLSYEAARRLGILAAGIALVEVSVYEDMHIPFKMNESDKIELDLELPFNNDSDPLHPEWQRDNNTQDTPAGTNKNKH